MHGAQLIAVTSEQAIRLLILMMVLTCPLALALTAGKFELMYRCTCYLTCRSRSENAPKIEYPLTH